MIVRPDNQVDLKFLAFHDFPDYLEAAKQQAKLLRVPSHSMVVARGEVLTMADYSFLKHVRSSRAPRELNEPLRRLAAESIKLYLKEQKGYTVEWIWEGWRSLDLGSNNECDYQIDGESIYDLFWLYFLIKAFRV